LGLFYRSVKTISEEEDVFSGSEEFYVDKWKRRSPYNKMTNEEAETIIKSKLNIIHRDKNVSDIGNCCDSCESF
jgi:hypothetical protein